MSPKQPKKKPISKAQATARLIQAETFYEDAELLVDSSFNSSVSLSSLAAIAACDAACGFANEVKSSDEHSRAAELLKKIPGSDSAVKSFGQLMAIKNKAQYDSKNMKASEAKTALSRAKKVIDFARLQQAQ